MRVFLTGATGFIGGHLLRALLARGHEVTCLARGAGAAALRAASYPGVEVVEGEFTRPGDWTDRVAGHEVVINAAGIIRERRPGDFEAVHAEAPTALFEAAAAAGARKAVQISALGADPGSSSRYQRTKGTADRRLADLGLSFVVFRPSLVYGPGDHSTTFFASLAALPVTPVPGDGKYELQPLDVEDLARAVVMAVERTEPEQLAVDVGGAEALPFDRILDELARWLGKPRGALKLHVPWSLIGAAAALTDALGGRGPITREELALLRAGNRGDNRPFIERFGFTPIPFRTGLARRPRTQAALWHARLVHVRVPLRLSVAFIWIASGLISAFLHPLEGSLSVLRDVGITGPLALALFYGICLFEVLLGLLTAAGYRILVLGTIQLLLIAGFTVPLTWVRPELWTELFGPLTKNIPLVGAILAMMALDGETGW